MPYKKKDKVRIIYEYERFDIPKLIKHKRELGVLVDVSDEVIGQEVFNELGRRGWELTPLIGDIVFWGKRIKV